MSHQRMCHPPKTLLSCTTNHLLVSSIPHSRIRFEIPLIHALTGISLLRQTQKLAKQLTDPKIDAATMLRGLQVDYIFPLSLLALSGT